LYFVYAAVRGRSTSGLFLIVPKLHHNAAPAKIGLP
jgi:hypothetical protein